MIILTETLIILDITKTKSNKQKYCFIIHYAKKYGSHCFASLLKCVYHAQNRKVVFVTACEST